jgi:hypothetical protein
MQRDANAMRKNFACFSEGVGEGAPQAEANILAGSVAEKRACRHSWNARPLKA